MFVEQLEFILLYVPVMYGNLLRYYGDEAASRAYFKDIERPIFTTSCTAQAAWRASDVRQCVSRQCIRFEMDVSKVRHRSTRSWPSLLR